MSSILNGKHIQVSVFGQSHSAAIGAVIDGLPAGFHINEEEIAAFMARRAPGKAKFATSRKEADAPVVLSGLADGVTCGAPLGILFQNTNTRSGDYSNLRTTPRPSHSDYAAAVRYGGFNDIAGGGHFSGRLTAPLCYAGAICLQILKQKGVEVRAHIYSVGDVSDTPFDPVHIQNENIAAKAFPVLSDEQGEKMQAVIEAARLDADSVGGVVECAVTGVKAGFGDPMFDGVDADGNIVTTKNDHGGILGGITSGMPIVFRAAFKPTPSIGKAQQSVNLEKKTVEELQIVGRHDPCIVPRAVPVVEAVTAITILDLLGGE